MIYMTLQSGQHILVLEPQNLLRIRAGKPLTSPDREVLVAYSPDIEWLAEQIQRVMEDDRIDGVALEKLLEEGLTRPEVHRQQDTVKKVL